MPDRDERFDAETHTYTVDGERYISVTEVFDRLGLVPEFAKSEEARARGSRIHLACHFLGKGTLDWKSVYKLDKPYVRGWEKFLKESGFVIEISERALYNHIHRYAGTPDCIGKIGNRPTVVDIKTGVVPVTTGLQTAAYGPCVEGGRLYDRMAVGLSGDGNYKERFHKPGDFQADLDTFLAMLRTVQWRAIHDV